MENITITGVDAIVTAPRKINLVVVRVRTNQPGLEGYGCATFTWRYQTVVTAIEQYLAPMLKGKSVHNIEELWQTMMGSSYWRGGPVLNNAISGVDEALWDIKGKLAGMPLYEMFGGKTRTGIALYRHADGSCIEEVEENISRYLEEGYRYIRCHMGLYGGNADHVRQTIHKPKNAPDGAYYDAGQYIRSVLALIERVRLDYGEEIELLHDVHERLSLSESMRLAKELEPYHLYFLEDALSPEQKDSFGMLRAHTITPLAVGELFTGPNDWKDLIVNHWIDYIRVHLSDIGGISPAIKLAHFAEQYQVKTAWHGPNDITPVGAVAGMHIDMAVSNFGIQEFSGFTEEEQEVFSGCPTIENGYAYLEDTPGIGVTLDERAAKKYPPVEMSFDWLYSRLPDGTPVRP